MATTYGTSYFVDFFAACRYYAEYGYDDVQDTVKRKLRDGEIHIGTPKLKDGETRSLNQEGRWVIHSR